VSEVIFPINTCWVFPAYILTCGALILPLDTNKRKTRKSDIPITREEELLLKNEALYCENELLKKLPALIQAEEKARKRKP
jgi:hypothetical protein